MFFLTVGRDQTLLFVKGTTMHPETLEPVNLDAGTSVLYRIVDAEGMDIPDTAGNPWPQTATYSSTRHAFIALIRDTVAMVPHVECRFVGTIDHGPDARWPFDEWVHPLHPGESAPQ